MQPTVGRTHQPDRSPYAGQVIAFGTMHGKDHQVGPAFAEVLDARLVAPRGIDTDQFGTFTGDIARTLGPLQAARAKARLAMTAADSPYGLASEASYAPLPGLGLPGHEELLVFLDDTRGIEIVEGERRLSDLPAARPVRTVADATPLVQRIDFGRQAVIVRAGANPPRPPITKGITAFATLRAAIRAAVAASPDGYALLEVDLRAHHNPARQTVLGELGHRLARRLATGCPQCRCPGYGRTGTRIGRPCAACGWPTDLVLADVHGCARCPYKLAIPRAESTAQPRWCERCNP